MSTYNTTTRDGKSINLGRKIWEEHYGEIPKGYVIHHIDGDTKNDRIENLRCMSKSEHKKLHEKEKTVFASQNTEQKLFASPKTEQ